MLKAIGCGWLLFVASICLAHDATYYSLNPKEIQQALDGCPARHPQDVSCEQLSEIATQVNALVSELRMDPQAYGRTILAMQETIATQAALTGTQQATPALQAELIKNQQALRERLSIIKWLESPVVR